MEQFERDGQPVLVGITPDLTEPRRASQAISHNDRNYRPLDEGVADCAIYMLDLDGHVTSWNSGAQRIKQFTAAEILGRHFREFYFEEERLWANPERNLIIAKRDGRYDANGWRLRKDGTQFWARVLIDPLRNEHGELIGFAKVTSDITEHCSADEVIREAGQRINTLIETVVDGVIVIDTHGRIQNFNPACQTLFGYRTEEVIGQSVKMLMPPPYRDQYDSYFDSYHRIGIRKVIGISREVIGLRKDGSTFPMNLSVDEAKHEGESAFVGVILDLTERKRIEERLVQAQKMSQDAIKDRGRLSITTANVSLDDQYAAAHPEVQPGEYVSIAVTDDGERMPMGAEQHAPEWTQFYFPRGKPLTAREQEVLAQVTTGATSKQAGRQLGISHRTVDVHRARIMVKLGAKNATDMIRIALSENAAKRA